MRIFDKIIRVNFENLKIIIERFYNFGFITGGAFLFRRKTELKKIISITDKKRLLRILKLKNVKNLRINIFSIYKRRIEGNRIKK